MQNDLTLVVLAAGMGSRFGGLKQIEPVGPNGEFIIDYSIYDALKAGFTKVVFIIKEENYEIFKETIGKRIEKHIKVEYCFQGFDNIPKGYSIPKTREKPLGTAHALYCAKDLVNENFAIISADDFYGRDAFMKIAEYYKNNNEFCVVGYKIGETLSEKGAVKRGVCMEENGYLTKVIESKVEKVNDKIIGQPLNGEPSYEMEGNHPVSMIMFGLTPIIFTEIEKQMIDYFETNKEDMGTCEFLLPDVLDSMIRNNIIKIKVLNTDGKWYGVTYREDLETIKKAIIKLIENSEYTKKLW